MYHEQLEWLLRNYPVIRALAENLRIELQNLAWGPDNTTEVIESLVFRRAPFGEASIMPIGSVSRKTENIALSYREAIANEQKQMVDDLVDRLRVLFSVADKLKASLMALNERERMVIEHRYFQGKGWRMIALILDLSISQCKRLCDDALNKLALVSIVTQNEYNKVSDMLAERVPLKMDRK